MDLSCLWKRGAALLVVLLGGLIPATAAEEDRAPAQERYHLYGISWTRIGPEYTYLGAHCTAGRAEGAKWGERYPEYLTVKSDRLKLPAAEKKCKYHVRSTSGKGPGFDKPFGTAEEAVAAAEAILKTGEFFRVTYNIFAE
jgi:hypothetical protein